LTELRAADLRFTPAEAADFLNRVMGLGLSTDSIAALETRAEGWIAGLQMAALSVQGQEDVDDFIKSFTGSHRFVLDYLVEEVLQKQTRSVQTFLLRTSILDRMCSPLCDALLVGGADPTLAASGQETLEYLEHANLFVVPLDNERRWYRYHHLFADLLRQRLQRTSGLLSGEEKAPVDELHRRASQWYEDNGLEAEAFRHAAAAHDIARAERLIGAGRIPLHSLAVVTAVLDWLDSLPKTVLDARPWLWVRSALSELMTGQLTGVEAKLQAAEAALAPAAQKEALDEQTHDLIGQIAAIRSTLEFLRYQPEAAIIQSRRALEHLQPANSPFRSRACWALGSAHELLGDRAAARQAYADAVRLAAGITYNTVLSSTGLGRIFELENRLHEAAETYRRSLQMLSDQGPPNASEEYIGLARIFYQWNDLDAAEEHGQEGLRLARQYDGTIDRFISCEVFLAHVLLARGDVHGAAATLAEAQQTASERSFARRLPEVAAAQVLTLIRQGRVAAAAQLARQYDLPLSRVRVLIAQGNPSAALDELERYRGQAEARGWADEKLKSVVLQAIAGRLAGEKGKAVQVLGEALALAEPGGFIRLFVDEGEPMRALLLDYQRLAPRQSPGGSHPHSGYVAKLLAAFGRPDTPLQANATPSTGNPQPTLLEPLSQRELEILRLIAQGFSNQAIAARLFLALNTVKGHNRVLFDKLQVESRTEAVARAHDLGLL